MNNCKPVRSIIIWTIMVIMVLSATAGPVAGDENNAITLVIAHTNDMHGHLKPHKSKNSPDKLIGGMAYLAGAVRDLREEYPGKVLLLDAGDMAQGTPISNIFRGIPVIEIMNVMKYDATTVGNHEFDWEIPALMKMIREADFPFISANILRKSNPNLLMAGVKPYVIREVNGVRIGIIGLSTPDTPQTTSSKNLGHLIFEDPETILRRYIPRMKQEGASIIIVLAHLGHDHERKLAERVRGIDVIIGGHSHTLPDDTGPLEGVIVTQAGAYAQYLGVLKLKLDPVTKSIVSYNRGNTHIPIGPGLTEPHRDVQRIIEKYDGQIHAKMSQVITRADEDITRKTTGDSLDNPLGNIITDSMRKKTGSQIAFLNSTGIRSDFYQGDITLEHIYQVVPFENHLVTMDIKGSALKKVLEHALTVNGCQVSGITMEGDYSRPEGDRFTTITIGNKPLNPDATYRLTTVDFLFDGGDGYVFQEAQNLKYDVVIRDALREYLNRKESITPGRTGRIRLINNPRASTRGEY